MLYFGICAAFVILLSLIIGILTLDYIKNSKYISYATPIGFVVLLGFYQIFTYPFQIFGTINGLYHIVFIVLCLIIIALAIKKRNLIVSYIKSLKDKKFQILIAAIIVIIFIYLYRNVEQNIRISDVKFYSRLIDKELPFNRITSTSFLYLFQGYYHFISSLLFYASKLSIFGLFTDYYSMGSLQWIGSLICVWMITFSSLDIVNYIKSKVDSKYLFLIISLAILIISFITKWNLHIAYYGNIYRKFIETIIFLLVLSYIDKKEFDKKSLIMIMISFFAFISTSSTSFPLSVMILYAYLAYSMLTKRSGYIKELLIISIPSFIYAACYLQRFALLIIVIYFVVVLLVKLKFDKKIEFHLNRFAIPFIILVPLLFIIIPYIPGYRAISSTTINTSGIFSTGFGVGDTDGTSTNIFDFKTLSFDNAQTFILWSMIILSSFAAFIKKKNNFIITMVSIVIITFFNPFVHRFVFDNLIFIVYHRISDLIVNPVCICCMVLVLIESFDKKYITYIICGCSLVYSISWAYSSNFLVRYKPNTGLSAIYHVNQEELDVIKELEQYLDPNESYVIASHIFEPDLFTNYNIRNAVISSWDDASNYTPKPLDILFSRRMPELSTYDEYTPDYEHACAIAYDNNIQYFIEEAQYNWIIEDSIWPCTEKIFEKDNWHVFRMNYDLWKYYIDNGEVEDTRPDELKALQNNE